MSSQVNFWQVIKHIPQLVKDDETDSYLLYTNELKEVLGSTMEPSEIKKWFEALCQIRSQLNTLEVDLAIDEFYPGLEDEELEFFKDWVVSRGQEDYEAVLENPKYLKQLVQTCINCLYGDFAEVGLVVWEDLYKEDYGEIIDYLQN